jgi:hypothetical protein
MGRPLFIPNHSLGRKNAWRLKNVVRAKFVAAGQDISSRPASSTSRTLRAKPAGVKGF